MGLGFHMIAVAWYFPLSDNKVDSHLQKVPVPIEHELWAKHSRNTPCMSHTYLLQNGPLFFCRFFFLFWAICTACRLRASIPQSVRGLCRAREMDRKAKNYELTTIYCSSYCSELASAWFRSLIGRGILTWSQGYKLQESFLVAGDGRWMRRRKLI